MNKVLVSLCLIAMPLCADAKPPKIESLDEGFYAQKWPRPFVGDVYYLVDSMAQLCFVSRSDEGVGLLAIPCASLARRTEWRPIITWALESKGG